MKEADDIYVLDTGSTDNTVEKLKKLGVKVISKQIKPWRFDTARNESLKLVPNDADICICTDLDEIFEKGWRKKFEQAPLSNKYRYNYIWSFDKYGNPSISFKYEKAHDRNNYKWVNAVHEVLKCQIKDEIISEVDTTLEHHPDLTKSRSSYLPLLELSHMEDPSNDRNCHYLGREYMYYGRNDDAIRILKEHLNLPTATWKDERSASMRFIARCELRNNNIDEALKYDLLSISEAPYLKEGYIETAYIYYLLKKFEQAIYYLKLSLLIDEKEQTYINEAFTKNGYVEDLLSISFFNIGRYEEASQWIEKAINKDPENNRLLENRDIIKQKIEITNSKNCHFEN